MFKKYEAMFKKYELFGRVSGEELIKEMGLSKSRLHDLVFNNNLNPYSPNSGRPLIDLVLQEIKKEGDLARALAIRQLALSRALGRYPGLALLSLDYLLKDLERFFVPPANIKKDFVTENHVSKQHQQAKERCREVAAALLKENPKIQIIDAIFHDKMSKVAQKPDGSLYTEKAIRGWINDLFPDESRKGGIRPKN